VTDEPHRNWRTDELRDKQRRQARSRRRRHTFLVVAALVALAAFVAVAFAVLPSIQHKPSPSPKNTVAAATSKKSASPTVSPSASATWSKSTVSPTPSSQPTPSVKATTKAVTATRPPIIKHYITFGAKREQQMAAYSLRHYGRATWKLVPKAIVIHYTAGGDVASAWNLFQANQPNVGELPGTVAHFIVGQDGKIYQLLPLDVRGRHTIGLNQYAIGIEFVQTQGSSDTWATDQILHRTAQIDAGVRLVRWLQAQYGIPAANVLGHGTANHSPLFKDLKGWTNDHADWGSGPMQRFKALLK
jgi:hypothetical protein